jgi:preprotein translocase subunit SecD
MKKILFFIITCIICFFLVSAGAKTTGRTKSVILQAADSNFTSQNLTRSAGIITERLKTYGLKSSFRIISGEGQIRFQLPVGINISEIEGLLTTKGELGLFETLAAEVGCSTFKDQKMVDSLQNYFKSISGLPDYKLLWGMQNSKSMTCLYALKTSEKGTSSFLRSDLETIKSSKDNVSQSITIELKFKPESAERWSVTTKNSLGKAIAIAVDDVVFYTPLVRSAMEDGLCEISGNFTQKEVNYFLALVNNNTLPVKLILKQ